MDLEWWTMNEMSWVNFRTNNGTGPFYVTNHNKINDMCELAFVCVAFQ